MPWARKRFKNGKIWVEVDPTERMIVAHGKVSGRYKQDDPRTYTFSADRIRELDGSMPEIVDRGAHPGPPGPPPPDVTSGGSAALLNVGELIVSPYNNASPIDELEPASLDHIEVYTDGACKGNPGEAALGVVLRWGPHHRELRQFLGVTTNNVAELMAIKVGLEQVKKPELPVRLHTDSRYALGVLTGEYKARKNQALIREIQGQMERFTDLRFEWVKGHAGLPLNERVDELANLAISERHPPEPAPDPA